MIKNSPIKFGLLKERKTPPDARVAFIPEQCNNLLAQYPQLSIAVEASDIRAIPDQDYATEGLDVVSSVADCDILFSVKEVPSAAILPGKTYCMFSHTIKKQQHNKAMLRKLMDQGCTLIDYELITDEHLNRTVAFGFYAGLVGAYNAMRGWGLKTRSYTLLPAHQCGHYAILKKQVEQVPALDPIKIVVVGRGRVGKGAKEMLDVFGIRQVDKQAFLEKSFDEPVYTVLQSGDYYALPNDQQWDGAYFHKNPGSVHSIFAPYAAVADMLITTAFWHPDTPPLFTKEEAAAPGFRTKLIADITCDVEGFVPITLRATTIAQPFYDYNRTTGAEEYAFSSDDHITMMTVDNLPCELPRDASCEFGRQLIDNFIPFLLGEDNGTVERATILQSGELTQRFQYLAEWVDEPVMS